MRFALLLALGLVFATGLGIGAHLIARDTVAEPVASIEAGEGLAPVQTTTAARTTPRARRTQTTTTTTARPRTTTATETDEDSGRGRGRGRGRSGGENSGSGGGDDSDD